MHFYACVPPISRPNTLVLRKVPRKLPAGVIANDGSAHICDLQTVACGPRWNRLRERHGKSKVSGTQIRLGTATGACCRIGLAKRPAVVVMIPVPIDRPVFLIEGA